MEVVYNEKKKSYDNTLMNLEGAKSKMDEDIQKKWEEYKQEETKYHYNNIQSEIYNALQNRLNAEQKFQKRSDARLSEEYQSYEDLFEKKLE